MLCGWSQPHADGLQALLWRPHHRNLIIQVFLTVSAAADNESPEPRIRPEWLSSFLSFFLSFFPSFFLSFFPVFSFVRNLRNSRLCLAEIFQPSPNYSAIDGSSRIITDRQFFSQQPSHNIIINNNNNNNNSSSSSSNTRQWLPNQLLQLGTGVPSRETRLILPCQGGRGSSEPVGKKSKDP